ncbi:MAG: hypothetical protein LBM77_09325, partial [Spirochaetaceae bacterium]|nr:hypothetical protein [Spirochaetaceae bacterium]
SAALAAENKAAEEQGRASRPPLVILGNEETGIPEKLVKLCSYTARIPGAGNVESLNVSVAAAIIMERLSN